MDKKHRIVKENKETFIRDLGRLLIENTREYADIRKIEYVYDDVSHEEYIYVTYESFAQKRINVSADANCAMLSDFVKRLNEEPWLMREEMHFTSFEDEMRMKISNGTIIKEIKALIDSGKVTEKDIPELVNLAKIAEKYRDKDGE